MKQNDQMYSLLAICVSLSPQKLDEHVENALRDKCGKNLEKVLQGSDESIFEEWFNQSSPKFTFPSAPDYEALPRRNAMLEPVKLQRSVFLREVRQQLVLPKVRSFLRLYTTLSVAKLASLLEMDEAALVAILLRYKHKARTLSWNSKGGVLEGNYSAQSDLSFYIEGDMIHVAESKPARRYAESFVRMINRFEDLIGTLEAATAAGAVAANEKAKAAATVAAK